MNEVEWLLLMGGLAFFVPPLIKLLIDDWVLGKIPPPTNRETKGKKLQWQKDRWQ